MKQNLLLTRVLAAALAMLVAGCSGAKQPKVPAPQTIDELKSAVRRVLTEHRIPGVGIALVSKDKVIWAGGAGKADLANDKDVTADTMFRIGSITKGFVALSILKLQEEGKISLD